jgi:hypothetical protein
MKTYKFVMLRVYATQLEYTAESLEDAQEMLFDDDNKYDAELDQMNTSQSFYIVDESQGEMDLKYTVSGLKQII